MYSDLVDSCVTLTDVELDQRLRRRELQMRRLQAEQAVLIALCRSRGVFRADGHRSINAYLRATLNASPAEAARLRRVSAACEASPELGEALFDGRVGMTQIVEIARIHGNPRTRPFFATVAPIFLERAEHCPSRELAADITDFINLADQDGSFDDLAADVEHRTAGIGVVGTTLDVRVSGGDPLVAAEVVASFDWFCQQEFRRDVDARRALHGDDADAHPLPRTDGQRRFDAFITMVRAARQHGDGTRPADVTVNVVADPETLRDSFADAGTVPADRLGDGGGDAIERVEIADHQIDDIVASAARDPKGWTTRRCRTSTGIPLHPVLLARAALHAHIRRVVLGAEGVIVDAGRRRRLFTGAARDLAKLLTQACSHPGCLVSCTYAEVDHMDEWHDQGRTDQSNADVGCSAHNRFKHQARWRTRRDDTGRPFRIRPDGTAVLPVGAREPDFTIRDGCDRARQRVEQLTADLTCTAE